MKGSGNSGAGDRARKVARTLRRAAGILVYVVVTSAIAFLLIELGARLWLTRLAPDDQFAAYASLDQLRARAEADGESLSRFVRHQYVGFVGAPDYRRGKNRHDDLGYRGEPLAKRKPRGEFRIACLGGSTTYTSMVLDYRKSFPYQLELKLQKLGYSKVRVINAGLPGYTSYETLVNFEFRILDLDPDMIIVYHAVNDALARLVWPPAAYAGDNSGFKLPSSGLEEPVPLLERSTAIRMVLVRSGLTERASALEKTFVAPAPNNYSFDFGDQQRRGIYPRGVFRRVDAATMLRKNRPTYFQRNLEHLMLIARHNGVQPVLATFAYTEREKGGDVSSTPEIRHGIDESNRIIRRVGAAFEVPVFDFAARFPGDPGLFVGGVHLNAKGAKLKADLFAEYLSESELIPRH